MVILGKRFAVNLTKIDPFVTWKMNILPLYDVENNNLKKTQKQLRSRYDFWLNWGGIFLGCWDNHLSFGCMAFYANYSKTFGFDFSSVKSRATPFPPWVQRYVALPLFGLIQTNCVCSSKEILQTNSFEMDSLLVSSLVRIQQLALRTDPI